MQPDLLMGYVPHNQEAEQGLLACLMIDARAVESIGDLVAAGDFYVPVHGRIFAAIMDIAARGQTPSPTLLAPAFENDPALKELGGARFLGEIAASISTVVNAADYARQVRDLAVRRAVIDAAAEAMAKARRVDADVTAASIIESVESALFRLAETGSVSKGPVAVGDTVDATMKLIEDAQQGRLEYVKTGIGALDKKVVIQPGNLVVIAGRPGMGKSVMGMTIAWNMASSGKRGIYFSMEMAADELTQRLIARLTGFPVERQLRQGSLERHEWQDLTNARAAIARLPLAIDETPGLTEAQIHARARRHKRRHGLDFVVVDYLNIMRMSDRYATRNDQIALITGALKNTAKELGVPVFLLAQLNRGVEGRDDKRPQMSDLRESGSIEQDADIIAFLYREHFYLTRNEPKRGMFKSEDQYFEALNEHTAALAAADGKADVIFDKIRQGQRGPVTIGFSGIRQVFHDLDEVVF